MHILGLPTDIFNVYPATIKFKTYQARWQIGDIYVSGDARKTEDNPQGLGCYLVMTGRGCDDIFRILDSRNCTFGDMFRRCERRYGLDNFHFTRLDIAIDDKNEKPFFTIEQIKKKCEKEEFISNSEGYHFDEMILSRLVDTFISRISLTMLPVPNPHNTVCVLSWEEARHWQSRSSGYSSS